MKPHRGVLILVLGILGFVFCPPLGIPAWIMGSKDLKEMDGGTMDPGGRGLTNAGKIVGIIATVLAALYVVAAIVVVAFMGLGVLGAAASHR